MQSPSGGEMGGTVQVKIQSTPYGNIRPRQNLDERLTISWIGPRKDFSQANFLDKLNKTGEQVKNECWFMMDRYRRADHYKPDKLFSGLAGKK